MLELLMSVTEMRLMSLRRATLHFGMMVIFKSRLQTYILHDSDMKLH